MTPICLKSNSQNGISNSGRNDRPGPFVVSRNGAKHWLSSIRWKNRPAKPGKCYCPTQMEHLANCATHAIPVIPSIIGMASMLTYAHSTLQYSVAIVYGSAVCILFIVSTMYHTLSCLGLQRMFVHRLFHISDRVAIYIYIAATYTPWLVARKFYSTWGSFFLYLVWMSAFGGIAYQCVFHERYKWIEILLYMFVGVGPSSCLAVMECHHGLEEVALGGLSYMIGVIFFKLDGHVPFAHAIWHLFVAIGASFHYYAVFWYLFLEAERQMWIWTLMSLSNREDESKRYFRHPTHFLGEMYDK